MSGLDRSRSEVGPIEFSSIDFSSIEFGKDVAGGSDRGPAGDVNHTA
ncbi:hypothetical protein [Streptomyces sp. NPDC059063]